MKKHLLNCIFAAPFFLFAQQTYVWNTSSGAWTNPANWSPARTTPAVNDILEFSSNTTITDMPAAESIGKLRVYNNAAVTLSSTVTSIITTGHSTITAPHFAVETGAALHISSTAAIELHIETGFTGEVSGNIDFFDGAHRLLAASANSLVFKSGAVFTANTGFDGNAFGVTYLNSVVFESGAQYINKAGGNPFGASAPSTVTTFQSGSIYNHQRATSMSISGRTYGNVFITGNSNYNLSFNQNCIIQNNLELWDNSFTLNPTPSSGRLKIMGDVILHGAGNLTLGTTTTNNYIDLDGADQTIGSGGGTGAITIKNLTVNNNTTTLAQNITITGTLNLQQGIIHSSSAAMPILDANAGIQSCTHDYSHLTETNLGCDNAYIEGPVQKQGLSSSDFAFPVGAAGKLRPLFLRNATGSFTAEYHLGDPYIEVGAALGAGIHHISHIEYWNVSGSGNSGVELSFYDPNSGGITDMSALRIARYTGTAWKEAPVANYRGTPGSNGSVTSTVLSEFGSFTLASASGYPNNPLPIELTAFTAIQSNGQIVLHWSLAHETKTLGYVVEKSADAVHFKPMPDRLPATGKPPYNYQLIDTEPFKGKNYYRLRIIQQDGSSLFSPIIAVQVTAEYPFRVYPNPARKKIFIKIPDSSSISTLAIVHINGSVVRLVKTGYLTVVSVDISNLSPGLYYIKTIRGQSSLVVPFFKYNQ